MEACEFVNFSIAKKLKGKGFKEKCLLHYESTGGFYSNSIDTYDRPNQELDYSDFLKCFNEGNSIGLIDAPTISQVLKWLRKEKELFIEIYMYHNCYLWEIYNTKIYDADFTQKSEKYSEIEYETPEQATLVGILNQLQWMYTKAKPLLNIRLEIVLK